MRVICLTVDDAAILLAEAPPGQLYGTRYVAAHDDQPEHVQVRITDDLLEELDAASSDPGEAVRQLFGCPF